MASDPTKPLLQVMPEAAGPRQVGTQSQRGTMFSRRWEGDRAPVVAPDMTIPIAVQREPDPGSAVDDQVPYGLAVTLAMPGVEEIYEQVRLRLAVPARVGV